MSESLKPSIPKEVHNYLIASNFNPIPCMSGFLQYFSPRQNQMITFGQRELSVSYLVDGPRGEHWQETFRFRVPWNWSNAAYEEFEYRMIFHLLGVVICNEFKTAI